jgi:hypothetical protein
MTTSEEIEKYILKSVKIGEGFYATDIADKLGVDFMSVMDVVKKLKEQGILGSERREKPSQEKVIDKFPEKDDISQMKIVCDRCYKIIGNVGEYDTCPHCGRIIPETREVKL